MESASVATLHHARTPARRPLPPSLRYLPKRLATQLAPVPPILLPVRPAPPARQPYPSRHAPQLSCNATHPLVLLPCEAHSCPSLPRRVNPLRARLIASHLKPAHPATRPPSPCWRSGEERHRSITEPALPPLQPLRPRGAPAERRGEVDGGGRTSPRSLALLSPSGSPISPRQPLPPCRKPIGADAENHADGSNPFPSISDTPPRPLRSSILSETKPTTT